MQVLCNIQVFAKAIPSLFSPYFEDFFICSSDSYQIKALKLDILAHIVTDSSIPFVLKEFQVIVLPFKFDWIFPLKVDKFLTSARKTYIGYFYA